MVLFTVVVSKRAVFHPVYFKAFEAHDLTDENTLKLIGQCLLCLFYSPDQPTDILCDFVHQMGVGKEVPLHAVAYDCSNQLTNVSLFYVGCLSIIGHLCFNWLVFSSIFSGWV